MKAFQFGKFVQVGNFKYALNLATPTFLGENSTISPANAFLLYATCVNIYLTPNRHTQFYQQQLTEPVFTLYLHYHVFFPVFNPPNSQNYDFFRLQIRIFNFIQILNSNNQSSNKTVASSLHRAHLYAFSAVIKLNVNL